MSDYNAADRNMLLDQIRALTDAERASLLHWLVGYSPADVHKALSELTPNHVTPRP